MLCLSITVGAIRIDRAISARTFTARRAMLSLRSIRVATAPISFGARMKVTVAPSNDSAMIESKALVSKLQPPPSWRTSTRPVENSIWSEKAMTAATTTKTSQIGLEAYARMPVRKLIRETG